MSAFLRAAVLALCSAFMAETAARCEEAPRRGVAWLMGETAPHAGVGAKLALSGGIDTSGMLLMMTAGTHGVAALVGRQVKLGDTLLVGLVGPEFHPEDGFGARFHAELWTRPTAATTASLVVACGSAEEHCWSRARFGRSFKGLQVGPEIVVASDRAGVGMAIAGARVGALDLEIAAGIEKEWHGDAAPYGSLTLIRRF